MSKDVFIVIRSSGERTETLCEFLIQKQVPKNQIIVIKERPFLKAVEKTFQLGISNNKKWTLAIDADILIRDNCINEMVESAEKQADALFVYQGFVKDKIFGTNRAGGPHLYRTKYLIHALDFLTNNDKIFRPESEIYEIMAKEGFLIYGDNKIYGLHDYEQYYKDLFRKALFHSKKHFTKNFLFQFLNTWKQNIHSDQDYKVIFMGWCYGIANNIELSNDIEFFNKITHQEVYNNDINEKETLDNWDYSKLNSFIENTILKSKDENLFKKIKPEPPPSLSKKLKLIIKNLLCAK